MTEEPETLSLGELLRARREELEMTVRQLAEQVGATPESVRHYESGIIPPPELRQKLQEALDLKLKAVGTAIAETSRRRRERVSDPSSGPRTVICFGCCPCRGAMLNSVDVLLRRCRKEKRDGNGRCKKCEVLKSKGAVLENGIKIVPLVARKP